MPAARESFAQNLPRTDRGWQSYLSNLRAGDSREFLTLGQGLTVCVETTGTKTFQARIRRRGDVNPRRMRIGEFPALSVADARRRLAEMKATAAEGRDPALEQRRERAGVVKIGSLGKLVTEYLARRETGVGEKTLRIERELLDDVLVPALGDRLLADLRPSDFGAVVVDYTNRLRRAGGTGTNANKLLAATRRMFARARGWGLTDIADPTAGLTRPVKEEPGERVLYDGRVLVGPDAKVNELGRLVSALRDDPAPIPVSTETRAALLLALLLGLRAAEAASLEWRAINLDEAPTLAVTRSKTKAGLRTLPLPSAAVAILRSLRDTATKGAVFVFPADAKASRVEHLHPESLSRAFARACQRLGIKGASTHDLRRTCLSGLVELGHEGVARRIAGHAAKDVLGRHYDRSSRLDTMRIALEQWAEGVAAAKERFESSEGHRT